MKYIVDAHFELLTDVAVFRKNGVLDTKEHNYSDERISLLCRQKLALCIRKNPKKIVYQKEYFCNESQI